MTLRMKKPLIPFVLVCWCGGDRGGDMVWCGSTTTMSSSPLISHKEGYDDGQDEKASGDENSVSDECSTVVL